MEIFLAVGVRLKEVRSALGLTQKQLCEHLGILQGALSKIEGEKQDPTLELLNIVFSLGVSPTWLLTGAGGMFVSEAESDEDFRRALPDAYALYKENRELRRSGETGCRLCPTINRLDAKRRIRVSSYAERLLGEQNSEDASLSARAGRPDGEVRERSSSYGEDAAVHMPMMGRIAAGPPLDTERWPDEWRQIRLKPGEDSYKHYLLEVSGTSMLEAGIEDGSLILAKRAEEAEPGDIVVAFEPQEGVTLKRLRRERYGGRLLLAWQDGSNRSRELTEQTLIQGVFVRVVKAI